MNFIKKTVCSVLMFVGLLAHSMHASDALQRTEFIRYIVHAEQKVVMKDEAIDRAFAICFGSGYVRKHYGYVKINNECTPAFHGGKTWLTREDLLKPHVQLLSRIDTCTNQTIQALCNAELDLEKLLIKISEEIATMADYGMDINARDIYGNTALDYAVTPEIRDAVIRAQRTTARSWMEWAQDNSDYIMIGGIVCMVVAGGALAHTLLLSSHNNYAGFQQSRSLRDEFTLITPQKVIVVRRVTSPKVCIQVPSLEISHEIVDPYSYQNSYHMRRDIINPDKFTYDRRHEHGYKPKYHKPRYQDSSFKHSDRDAYSSNSRSTDSRSSSEYSRQTYSRMTDCMQGKC